MEDGIKNAVDEEEIRWVYVLCFGYKSKNWVGLCRSPLGPNKI